MALEANAEKLQGHLSAFGERAKAIAQRMTAGTTKEEVASSAGLVICEDEMQCPVRLKHGIRWWVWSSRAVQRPVCSSQAHSGGGRECPAVVVVAYAGRPIFFRQAPG